MRLYRIAKAQFAATALSGLGAAMHGGRWNSPGTRLAYTGESRSLVMLELLVHIPRNAVPGDFRLLACEIPDTGIETLAPADYPEGWSRLPYHPAVRACGDDWARQGRSLALRVPSAIVRGEFNVLVNPAHADFARVALVGDEALSFDARLFG